MVLSQLPPDDPKMVQVLFLIVAVFQSLHMVLSQLPPDDPKTIQRQQACNPTLFQILLHSNFNMSAFLPHLTARTLSHLRQIMDDTVMEASNFLPSQAGASPVSLVSIFYQWLILCLFTARRC